MELARYSDELTAEHRAIADALTCCNKPAP
jgi:hypothetical protein